MAAIVMSWMVRVFGLAWLTGPIFDKEMRVSSRRRRNYVLRFLYIGLFTFLLAIGLGREHGRTAEHVGLSESRAWPSAGQAIVSAVLWFEFLAAQVIAVVMLSTSISDEIYHRTLGVLMTTPIGSFQIVVGKLLSKLLQLVLLLAISLPLLAIVRVFGGVPWDFLVVRLVRDADDVAVRRVAEPVLLDLHPPGVLGDPRDDPGDRVPVRGAAAAGGVPGLLSQRSFGRIPSRACRTRIRMWS